MKEMRAEVLKRLKTFSLQGVELLAVGILGSVARGDFNEKSDIDAFVIIDDKDWSLTVEDRIRKELEEHLADFGRDITLFLYFPSELRKVLNWHMLSMVRDAIFAFGRNEIKKIFKDILRKAREAGMIMEEVDGGKIFTKPDIKFGEIIEVSLE